MRILILNYEYPPLGGGAGHAMAQILKHYQGIPDLQADIVASSHARFEVRELSPGLRLHLLDINKRGGLHRQTLREIATYAQRALEYCRSNLQLANYDLCHAFFGVPCGWVGLRLGLPTLISLRGSDVPFNNPSFKWIDRLLLGWYSPRFWRRAAGLVANSQRLADQARQFVPEREVLVIPNGVELDRFYPAAEPPPATPLRLLCVARFNAVKRIDALLEAFAMLPKGAARLTLVGGGKLHTVLVTQAERLGIANQMEFMGQVEQAQMPEIYRRHTLYVMPSMNEGMSNTMLEALASGLPLVVCNVGGVAELVRDGENGTVLPDANPQTIASALLNYVEKPLLTSSLAVAARSVAVRYAWHTVADRYLALYHQLLRNQAKNL